MGSRSAIDDDRVRVALGRSVATLQHLMHWGAEALRGLDQYSDPLADLARALLRNHATPPQVQRLIGLLDRGSLGTRDDEGLTATRHQLLRLVFEGAASLAGQEGGMYPNTAWEEATSSGAFPFDTGLDQVALGAMVSRFEVVRGDLWGDKLYDKPPQGVAATYRNDLHGVTIGRIRKFNYPQREGGGEVAEFEKECDRLGERAHLSLAVAIMFLHPALIGPDEHLVFSGRPMSGVGGALRFPAVFRGADGHFWVKLLAAQQFAGVNYYTVRIVD